MLTSGRGSNVGGTTLSRDKLSGNKFWKYLVWRYGRQLLPTEEVPDYLKEMTRSGNLVTENHVSKNKSSITCGACYKQFGTEHHGHDRRNLNCPAKDGDVDLDAKIVQKRERDDRKVEEKCKFHKLAEGGDKSQTFGRGVAEHMETVCMEPID